MELKGSALDSIITSVNLSDIANTYSFKKIKLDTYWTLNPYAAVAASSLSNFKKDIPHEVLTEVVKLARGEDSASIGNAQEKFIAYSKPYIGLAIGTIVFAVTLIIIGFSHCILSCVKKCGTVPIGNNPSSLKSKARFVFILGLCLTGVFAVMSGSAIASGRQRFSKGIGHTRTLIDYMFQNLVIFQESTLQGLEMLLIRQLDDVSRQVVDSLEMFSERLMNEVKGVTSTAASDSLISLEKSLKQVESNLTEMFGEVIQEQKIFKQDVEDLEKQINEMNGNLSLAKAMCEQNATINASGICQSPGFDNKVSMLVNASDLAIASNDFVVTLGALASENLTDLAHHLNITMTNIVNGSFDVSAIKREHFEQVSTEIQKMRNKAFWEIEEILKYQFTEHILLKDEQVLAMFDQGGTVGNATLMLSRGLAAIAVCHLVLGLFLAFSICITFPVLFLAASGKLRGRPAYPKFSRRLLLSSFYKFLLFSLPLLTILAIMVAICGCLTKICLGLKNDSIIKNMDENPEPWGGKVLGLKKIFPGLPDAATLERIIDVCGYEDNATFWHAARFNEAIDLREKFKLKQLKEKFFGLDNAFGVKKLTTGMTTVEESSKNLSTALQGFNQSTRDPGKLVNTNLTEYGDYLSRFAEEVGKYDAKIGYFLGGWGKKTTNVVSNGADKAKNAKDGITNKANDVVQKGKDTVKDTIDAVKNGKNPLDVLKDFQRKFREGMEKVFLVVDQFIGHVEAQFNKNIGKCGFISELYNTGKDVYCSYLMGGVHVVWLSIGVTYFMFAVFMFCFMRMSYYLCLAVMDAESSDRDDNSNVTNTKGSQEHVLDVTEVADPGEGSLALSHSRKGGT